MNNPDGGSRRLPARPFVGARSIAPSAARTFAYTPPRPFAFAGQQRQMRTSTVASSMTLATPPASPTPLWTVAVYQRGMSQTGNDAAPPSHFSASTNEVADASLALADDVVEAERHASSLAAAEVLEGVARRLRRGEILLLPGASTQTEAAVMSSVLAALLGGRR